METVAKVIPFTAWEQAVFVGLFIILVVGLLAWFTKQSEKWQGFMLTIDEKWRAFNKEQRSENNCEMKDVKRAVSDLVQVTQALVSETREMRADSSTFYTNFLQHDLRAKAVLAKVDKVDKTIDKVIDKVDKPSKTKPIDNKES